MSVLLEAERVVSAGQRSLDVAQDSVHSEEPRMLGAGRTPADDTRFMHDARLGFNASSFERALGRVLTALDRSGWGDRLPCGEPGRSQADSLRTLPPVNSHS